MCVSDLKLHTHIGSTIGQGVWNVKQKNPFIQPCLWRPGLGGLHTPSAASTTNQKCLQQNEQLNLTSQPGQHIRKIHGNLNIIRYPSGPGKKKNTSLPHPTSASPRRIERDNANPAWNMSETFRNICHLDIHKDGDSDMWSLCILMVSNPLRLCHMCCLMSLVRVWECVCMMTRYPRVDRLRSASSTHLLMQAVWK